MLKRVAAFYLLAALAFACSVDYTIWIPRSDSADPLYRFVKHGKSGYIDRSGRVVIPPKFRTYGNGFGEFHDGLLEVGLSGGRYVDRTGKVVIGDGLSQGWEFSEGLAPAVRNGGNRWGYINTSGQFAISPRFETRPGSFSDGLALIQVKEKFGFIDHTGKFAIEPIFLQATSFSDGMARVILEGPCTFMDGDGPCPEPEYVGGREVNQPPCKFTFIDKAGRVITTQRFDYARDFSEGLAPAKIGDRWGYIDKTGVVVVAPKFEDAQPFSSGLSGIRDHYLYGYSDKTGAVVIPPAWHSADDFSEGLAVVGDPNGPFRYINRKGEHAFQGEFAVASRFFKGLAQVRLLPRDARKAHATFAYIDTTGRCVFTY